MVLLMNSQLYCTKLSWAMRTQQLCTDCDEVQPANAPGLRSVIQVRAQSGLHLDCAKPQTAALFDLGHSELYMKFTKVRVKAVKASLPQWYDRSSGEAVTC